MYAFFCATVANWVVVTETVWPKKPERSIIRPFRGKCCQSLNLQNLHLPGQRWGSHTCFILTEQPLGTQSQTGNTEQGYSNRQPYSSKHQRTKIQRFVDQIMCLCKSLPWGLKKAVPSPSHHRENYFYVCGFQIRFPIGQALTSRSPGINSCQRGGGKAWNTTPGKQVAYWELFSLHKKSWLYDS